MFAGTPKNAAQTLQRLLEAGAEVVGVLTRLDASVGRKGAIVASPVAILAQEKNLPLWKTNHLDEQTRGWLKSLESDVGVIVAYGSILRAEDLEIPRMGWLNLHYSLLPQLPGPAPVQHAIMQGMKSTGVTIFSLDTGVDTGPILAQKVVDIGPNKNSGELISALTASGSELLVEVLGDLTSYLNAATAQPKGHPGAVAYKPSRSLAKLDFAKTAESLVNLVRAMNPEPMAWFEYQGNPIRVHSVRLFSSQGLGVGEATISAKTLVVGCGGGGGIELLEVQPAGKNPMSGADWFRGLHLDRVHLG